MSEAMLLGLCLIVGYTAGSISTAILVCRIMGLPDPRLQGSQNPGATNVLRLGGKKAAAITLLGDSLKGFLPVIVAKFIGLDEFGLVLTAFAAFLGHLYPIFFGFAGGKGVATAFGALLALRWEVALAVLATWLFVAFVMRISSLAALVAAALTPFFSWYFGLQNPALMGVTAMVLILVARHHRNIRKLWLGKEESLR